MKKQKVYMIGNAHLDTAWVWSWQEGSCEAKATIRCEFVGWFYLGKEGNFDTDIVNYNINLQSKWKKVAIGGTSSNDSMVSNDSTQQGNQSDNEYRLRLGNRFDCKHSAYSSSYSYFFARRKKNNIGVR